MSTPITCDERVRKMGSLDRVWKVNGDALTSDSGYLSAVTEQAVSVVTGVFGNLGGRKKKKRVSRTIIYGPNARSCTDIKNTLTRFDAVPGSGTAAELAVICENEHVVLEIETVTLHLSFTISSRTQWTFTTNGLHRWNEDS